MKLQIRLIIYVLISLIVCANGFSQSAADEKLRLAESYEKSGDFTNASRLYEDLYNSGRNSKNSGKYFLGLVRSYKGLNKFSNLLPIIENELKTNKTSQILTLYGEILWRTGKTHEANTAWDEAIELNNSSTDNYEIVAETQIMLHLPDKAITTLEKARSALNNQLIFADELSQLYIATGNYSKGTQEILKLFTQTTNLPQAQGRISALMTSDTAISNIGRIINETITSNPRNILLLKLQAWFERANKNFDKAFETYIEIDNISGSKGIEIINFAYDCQRDGHYDISLKAYEYVIDKINNPSLIANALFGYVRTMELKLAGQQKFSEKETGQIIERYRNIIKQFPGTTTAADCNFRIAVLMADQLHDYDGSIQELNSIIKKYKQYPIATESALKLASIYLVKNEVDSSRKFYKDVLRNLYPPNQLQAETARFQLAELEFYTGNTDSAQSMFNNFLANTSSNFANRALKKAIFIEQNKNFIQALKLYGRAELFELQNNYDDALKTFLEASTLAAGSDLSEQAMLSAANIEFMRQRFVEARKYANKLLEMDPETIYGDNALIFIANTFYEEKNYEEALKSYSSLLSKFPKSIYLEEAREKIKKIRLIPKS
jgi:tetratricopeptide (TPR) repeat protein